MIRGLELSASLQASEEERRAESWVVERTTWIAYIIFYDLLRLKTRIWIVRKLGVD